jgi:K+-transporting ATPase A subunit
MTIIGWVQILLYCAIIVALTPVLGGYMTRVFNGERTFLTPILRPVELALYRAAGIDEKREQGWLAYTVGMLLFHVGRISPSTRRSVSSPTPTGRTTAARARCRTSRRCSA